MIDLDYAGRLVREGQDLVMIHAPRHPDDEARLRKIEEELRSLLWCQCCQAGDFADCKIRRTKWRRTKRRPSGPPCSIRGWYELIEEARERNAG